MSPECFAQLGPLCFQTEVKYWVFLTVLAFTVPMVLYSLSNTIRYWWRFKDKRGHSSVKCLLLGHNWEYGEYQTNGSYPKHCTRPGCTRHGIFYF